MMFDHTRQNWFDSECDRELNLRNMGPQRMLQYPPDQHMQEYKQVSNKGKKNYKEQEKETRIENSWSHRGIQREQQAKKIFPGNKQNKDGF